jgi:hypothetical protein
MISKFCAHTPKQYPLCVDYEHKQAAESWLLKEQFELFVVRDSSLGPIFRGVLLVQSDDHFFILTVPVVRCFSLKF